MTRDLQIFCSDVHLQPGGGLSNDRFLVFLESVARSKRAQSLHILGDLFHYWLGQGHERRSDYQSILTAFQKITKNGISIHFIWGNRDFLVSGRPFEKRTGIALHGDEYCFEWMGRRIKLIHGDLLCAGDVSYQRFRKIIRSTPVQFLARVTSLELRKGIADRLRRMSEKEVKRKSYKVMDLDEFAVRKLFMDGSDLVVCGHIPREQHRPYDLGTRKGDLYVLGAWDDGAPFLVGTSMGQFQFDADELDDRDY